MNYDVANDAFLPVTLVFALAAAMLAVIAERTRFFPRAFNWLRKDPVVRTALVALLLVIGPITARTKNGQMSLLQPQTIQTIPTIQTITPSLDLVSVRTNGVAFVAASSNAVEVATWRQIGGTEMGAWIESEEPFFMLGTNPVHRAYVCASGSVSFESMRRPPVGSALPDRWTPPSGRGEEAQPPGGERAYPCLCPFRAPLGFVPEANLASNVPPSRFWHDSLPGGGMVLTWENALVDRLPGRPVSLQVELRPSGDCAFRYDFPDELDPPPTNFVMGAQMGTNGVNALSILGTNLLAATVWRMDGGASPPGEPVSVADLLCTNGILRTPATFELRWRNTTGLDPEADTDNDGLTDWDEIFLHGTEPLMTDTDLDGIPDGSEIASGLHPLVRDSDGDGLVDGSDPDPATPTSLADLDGDTLPDAYETYWFGGTNLVDVVDERDDTGFTLAAKLLGGINPTNTPAEPCVASTNALVSWRLLDGYAADWPADVTSIVWERTFAIHRTSAWQQFFVSASPTNAAAWRLDGMVLEWETDGGSCGTVSTSPRGDSFRIPLPADDLATTLTLRLRATEANGGRPLTDGTDSTDSPRMPLRELRDLRVGNTFASLRVPTPLHLIAYAPELAITGGLEIVGQSGATFHVFTDGVHSQVGLSIDHSRRPCRTAPVADEYALGDFVMSSEIGPDGGPLAVDRPGIYTISSPSLSLVEPPSERNAPNTSFIPPPSERGDAPEGQGGVLRATRSRAGGNFRKIIILDPSAEWLCHGHGCAYDGLGYDWMTDTYGEELTYPLDTACLRKMWYRDWSGGWIDGNCELEVRSGLRGDSDGPVSCLADGDTGYVFVDGEEVWSRTVPHAYGEDWCEDAYHEGFLSGECDSCDFGCAGGNCDDQEGPRLGSLRFRIPLGAPVRGQVAGFVWLASDGPLAISRSAFQLLPHPSATVSDTTASGIRRIVCADPRGRDLAIEDIVGGVRVTIRETASQALEHTWEITNENGDPACIRLRKISRLNNVMSDETFACANGDWTRIDNIAGVSTRLETYGDWSQYGSMYAYRTTTDAQGRVLADVALTRSRIGSCDNAVLRETYRSEATGRDHAWTAAEYWDDPGHSARHGQPRLVWGNARPWVYTDFDDDGRSTLRVEQRGNADVPWSLPRMDAGGLAAIAPHLSDAFVTVRDYMSLPDDSSHPDDAARPRTETRYVVRNGVATVVGRTWTRHTRLVRDGFDAVKSETWRCGDPARCGAATPASLSGAQGGGGAAPASLPDSYSYTISYTDTGDGTPLLLRGALAESLDEDGILTVNAYSLSGGVLFCTTHQYRAEQAFPTYETTERDAAHGTLLRRTTRLTKGDAVIADEQSLYDEKNRLRSTTYLDGTSITNAYSCCRLLWTRDRERRTVLRSAQTGTDHLYHAMEDVWLADVSTNGAFRVTQHFFDALGRETNTVVYIGTEPGAAVSPDFTCYSSPVTRHCSYPYGGDDCVVSTDERGAVTRTLRNLISGAVETVESIRTNGVEVLRTTTRSLLGGGTTVRREWDNVATAPSPSHCWTEERRFDDYAADGTRLSYVVTTSSDYGVVTNSVSTYDLLGRLVSVSRPGANGSTLTTSYAYDGMTSRVLSSTETAGDIVRTTAYLYNDCAEQVGSAIDSVTNRTDVAYETDTSNIVWRVTTRRSFSGAKTNVCTVVRERLTGLGCECRSCVETQELSGRWARTTLSFDPETAFTTESVQSSDNGESTALLRYGLDISTSSLAGTGQNEYDAYGRIERTSQQNNDQGTGTDIPVRKVEYSHSQAGDLVERRTFTNATDCVSETWTHDSLGNEISSTDPLGDTVSRQFDPLGSVVSESGATYPIQNAYDTTGRRTALLTTRGDGAWDATIWTLDPATGHQTAKTYADGSTIAYTHTPDGLPLRTTWASGRWMENGYDIRRNRVQATHSDGTADFFAYDEFSRETAFSNEVASVVLSRDGRGNVTNETMSVESQTHETAREFDETGRLSSCDGVRYAYAEDGKICGVSNEVFHVVYRYSGDRLDAGYDVFLTNGTTLTRAIGRDGYRRSLVTNIVSDVNGVAVETFAYAYDAAGRPVSRNGDSFGYNDRGEVVSATVAGIDAVYGYDGIGNSTNYPANSLNQYTTLSYDLDGNMVSNGVFAFTYDAANRLAGVASNGVVVATYAYDPKSRRVRKTTAEAEHFYFYDGWNLVEERIVDTNGITSAVRYIWGKDISGTLQGAGGIGGLLAVSVNGAYYFPTYDGYGNVTRYLDAYGATVAAYVYDAFGNTLFATGPMADVFSHRFSTKYYDPESGLYYYGYRFYSPELGRWINRDPATEIAGGNLYGFCSNNAITLYDCLGLIDVKVLSLHENTFWEGMFRNAEKYRTIEVSKPTDIIIYRGSSRSLDGSFSPSPPHADACGKSVYISVSIFLNQALVKTPVAGVVYTFSPHTIVNGTIIDNPSFTSDHSPFVESPVLLHEYAHADVFIREVVPLFKSKLESHFAGGTIPAGMDDELKKLLDEARNECLQREVDYTTSEERRGFALLGMRERKVGANYEYSK